jgi:hypothetical protein
MKNKDKPSKNLVMVDEDKLVKLVAMTSEVVDRLHNYGDENFETYKKQLDMWNRFY